ncbi:ABC-2 family transporter [Lacrimispora xylanisolvens]|uniref:ABC-2 family transporter n=1 Tax=Lacrimispora xylanisolvens TaxID=384636 RepID=A0A2S6HQ66_9FIRM|nr:ABC transporter permease [Hungatella xylanolytica]PPK79721.1 ABC-2 family transporter [Hungatella xylanolytica]
MKLTKFLFSKGVIYAIILAVFYQIAMVGLYIYGYHVLPDGVNQLTINVVNQDGDKGEAIEKELVPTLSKSFSKVITDKELTESKEELDSRQIQMIIVIPENFVSNLETGKSTIDFYIDESNTTTVINTMEAVAKSVTDNFNQAINQGKLTNILKSLNVTITEQEQITEQLNNSVVQNNVYINKAPGSMDYVMTPSFLSIAAYASSMVVAIVLMNIFLAFIPVTGKWKAFQYVEITGCVIAVVAPLFGVIMTRILISISMQKMISIYLQQIFMQITAFQFTLIFSLLFGQNGIFINIPLMLAQTIAGGGTMPLQIMPDPFKVISYFTPMYPNTQINFGILYGGPMYLFEIRLLAILITSSLVLVLIVWRKWSEMENGRVPVSNNVMG